MSAAAGGWVATSASVRGASHERSGKPNQDAVRVLSVGGATPGVVAAVCDGHGGDRYVRSDVGSRFGAEEAGNAGRLALETLGPSASPDVIEAHLRTQVTTSIVERWRARVEQDVLQRPFTDDERVRAGDPLDRDPLIAYGCTLVLGLCAEHWIGFVQIGDGDVTIVSGSTAGAPVPGDDRLVGGETTSLCLPTAVADARVVALVAPLPDLVLLTSDGYANSFASPTWRSDAGLDLRRHVDRLGIDGVEKQLAGWLTDSAIAAGDDVSMALIHRTVRGDSPSVPSSLATPTGVPSPPRSRRLALVAVAGAAALAGLGIGWLLASGGDETDAIVNTTTPIIAATTLDTLPPSTSPDGTRPTTVPMTTTTSVPTPNTTPPSGVPTDVIPLRPQDQVLLLVGEARAGADPERLGVVLAFDPGSATEPNARSFGWVIVDDKRNQLPPRWSQGSGVLGLDGKTLDDDAIAVISNGTYVWAVASDRTTLTAYDAVSGAVAGRSSIVGADGGQIPSQPNSQTNRGTDSSITIPPTSETTQE